MSSLAAALLDLRELDRLALRDSPVHRLDARAKALATAAFLAALASFGRLEVSGLLPFALYPVSLVAVAGVPAGLVGRKILFGLPFILVLGALLPVLERAPALVLAGHPVSAGWLAYLSLLLRGALAVAASTILVAVTGLGDLGAALHQLGLPRPFVQQLLLLHRFLFLVGEETQRRLSARALRAHGRSLGWAEFPAFAGQLLLRSWERAERVHAALLARGFRGALPARNSPRFGPREWSFLLGWLLFFAACRVLPVARLVGGLVGGGA